MGGDLGLGRGGRQVIPRPVTARPGRPAPWAGKVPARPLALAQVRTALAAAPSPRSSPVERAGGRAAAVLAAVYEHDDEAWVVLTRRAQALRSHSGEVCFPGGGQEPGEALTGTALREAEEEIGLDRTSVELIGELDHLSTVTSSSYIVPFVGTLPARPTGLVAQDSEVEQILHVPFSELLDDGVFHEEIWSWEDQERPIWFFDLVGDTVWGATAAMLRQLLSLVSGVTYT